MTAWDQPCDSLPTLSMVPFLMCHTTPLTSRSWVVSSVIASTLPVATPALTAAAAVLAVGVGYHVVSGPDGLTAYEQKQHQTQQLNREMQDLQRENDLLKGHVEIGR